MNFLNNEYTLLGDVSLGESGFAYVYKARHNELKYLRAIRVLKETVTDKDCKPYLKFLRECKVLLRLGNGNHRNIVHIYQPRLLNKHAFVEMDFVEGKNLNNYLKDNEYFLPIEEVLRMVDEMSSALAYCHEDIYKFCINPDEDKLTCDPHDGSSWIIDDSTRQHLIKKYRVIHNDIHSGNIMRREDGSFVLIDFGLAIDGDEKVISGPLNENDGAPEYMSPEKWEEGNIISEQSDIYSFGIVMFEYLAGRVPFVCKGNSIDERTKLYETIKSEASLPSISEIREAYFKHKYPNEVYKKDYPDWLEEAIVKCLQIDPAKRFRNGKELRDFIIDHRNKDSSSHMKTIVSLRQDKEKLETKVSELEKRIKEFEDSGTKGELDVVREELERVRNELQKKEGECEKMKDEIKKFKGHKENKWTTIGLSILSGVLIVGLVFGSISNSQLTKENVALKNSDSSNLIEEVTKLESQLKQKDKDISAQDKKIASLESHLYSQTSDSGIIQNLQEELNTADSKISKLERELDRVKAINASLKMERDALRDAINP